MRVLLEPEIDIPTRFELTVMLVRVLLEPDIVIAELELPFAVIFSRRLFELDEIQSPYNWLELETTLVRLLLLPCIRYKANQ